MVKKFFGCGRRGINQKRGDWCTGHNGGSCRKELPGDLTGPKRPPCQPTPLSKKSKCGRTRVCGVNGDRKHCARLASLGLYPGNEIELISAAEGECGIIKVHGGTVSIDRDTMDKIMVTD